MNYANHTDEESPQLTDRVVGYRTAVAGGERRTLLSAIRALFKTYFDTVYETPVGAKKIVLNDLSSVTEYTLTDEDLGKVVQLSSFDPIDLFIPEDLAEGFNRIVVQGGNGAISISASGGVSIQSRGNLLTTNGPFARANIVQLGANICNVSGDLV